MRASTLALVRDAQDKGYAVPAFNIVDALSLRAVVEAADVARSPVIIQASLKTAMSVGVELLTRLFDAAVANVTVPVALHLDHCPNPSMIEEVVRARWSSVLFDASDMDLDKAVRATAAICELAHAAGVDVESEIENIVGVEDGVGSNLVRHAYTAEQVAEAAGASGADLIAPQLGTAHGQYKGRPHLLPERVLELRTFTDKPIVLHGGTGLTREEFRSFVAAGISKINISTAVKHSYMQSSFEFLKLAVERDQWDPASMFQQVQRDIGLTVSGFLDVFGSAGRIPTQGT